MTRQVRAPPPKDSWESALEEARDLRHASPAAHAAELERACALAFEILRRHPDRQAMLDREDPLPSDAVALIDRLRRGAR